MPTLSESGYEEYTSELSRVLVLLKMDVLLDVTWLGDLGPGSLASTTLRLNVV